MMVKRENFDLKLSGFVFDAQRVSDTHFAGRLGADAVGFDAAHFAGLGGKFACLEEARRPKPFVDPRSVHADIVLPGYPPPPIYAKYSN